MTSTYRVTCQDASGRKATVTVQAASDQGACTKAIKELNTWRPIRATRIDPEPSET